MQRVLVACAKVPRPTGLLLLRFALLVRTGGNAATRVRSKSLEFTKLIIPVTKGIAKMESRISLKPVYTVYGTLLQLSVSSGSLPRGLIGAEMGRHATTLL